MMDRHDPQRHPALPLLPGHPVGDRPHLDRGEHRLSEHAASEEIATSPHGMVVAHVLIDDEADPGLAAAAHDFGALGIVAGQRLLREDPADSGFLPLDKRTDPLDDLRLDVGRYGDVNHLHRRIFDEPLPVGVHCGDAVTGRHLLGRDAAGREDRHWIEPRSPVSDEVAVGHDEPRSDATDADRAITGERRQVCSMHGRRQAHRLASSPDVELGWSASGRAADRSRATSSQSTFADDSPKRFMPTSRMAPSGTTDRGV